MHRSCKNSSDWEMNYEKQSRKEETVKRKKYHLIFLHETSSFEEKESIIKQ